MSTTATQFIEFERIAARIVSLSAEKARIEADIASATEEFRTLFADRIIGRGKAGKRVTNVADTTTATEIACLLRVSERSAHRLVQYSALLVNHHPRTLAALRSGEISWQHATTLLYEYTGLPHGIAAGVEDALLPVATNTTVPRLSYRARRLRTQLHPVSLDDRARAAVGQRRVDVEPADDAMAWLHVHLPAVDAVAIDARLTSFARGLQAPIERRTLPQLRTDVLTDLLLAGCASGLESRNTRRRDEQGDAGAAGVEVVATDRARAPSGDFPAAGAMQGSARADGVLSAQPSCSHGGDDDRIRAHINVTVPVLTLLGVDDAPADLEGYGPVPAETARRLAAHAPSFTRLLTHPETGAVLSVGRTTYSVPSDLKKWLRVRDGTYRHPGCGVAASRCELDHTQPWSQRGLTAHNNLAHLCRKHHMLKSEGIWHYAQPRPGVLAATSPGGRTYICDPEPLQL